MRKGNPRHEAKLKEVMTEMESNGWRIVDLQGTSPDAVASKDGKIVCIEVVGKYGKERNYKLIGGWTISSKKKRYQLLGFDDVLVYDFPYFK